MNIRTLQWNIGGGRTRSLDADPTLAESYAHDDLAYVIGIVEAEHPDIVTLQEVHGAENNMQAMKIARALGFNHVVYDVYAESHLAAGQSLGQAIISRFPIMIHDFAWFDNPKLTLTRPDGAVWNMHDKGVTRCLIDIGGKNVEVETLHMPPFRKFGMDILGTQWKGIRADYARKLMVNASSALLQGDFNFDQSTVRELLPELFAAGFTEWELTTPTTPRGKMYDHILAKGLVYASQRVRSDVRTDHFPVITDLLDS